MILTESLQLQKRIAKNLRPPRISKDPQGARQGSSDYLADTNDPDRIRLTQKKEDRQEPPRIPNESSDGLQDKRSRQNPEQSEMLDVKSNTANPVDKKSLDLA